MSFASLYKPRCSATVALFAAALFCFTCDEVCSVFTPASGVRLVNNGYEGVIISIHERVNESETLIESIKKAFTRASKELFVSTRRRVFFRNISILVPESWNLRSYEPATWQTYSKAPIRVDNAAGLTRPYVSHFTKCGEPGEYMMLPEIMFKERYTGLHKNEEDRAKEIVHRWAHLRWGLFDEYPITESDAQFYLSADGTIEPVRCSKAINGIILCPSNDGSGHEQNVNYYNQRCWFNLTDNSSADGVASYMYSYTLRHVTEFCDNDPSNPGTLHNSEAPNQQNTYCAGKSAWEVMRQHQDFNIINSAPRDENFVTLAVPHFSIVQRHSGAYVIVMDISGSMLSNNNHIKLHDAVKKFIRTVVPDGSFVGLVQFDDRATALTPNLYRVSSEESRRQLASMVSPVAGGWTSIGAGMQTAFQLLQRQNMMRGSIMLVITDGMENRSPYVRDVLPSVQSAGIIIDTLLLTINADQQMINSSAATGGRSYFVSGVDDVISLSDVLSKVIESQQTSEESSPVLIAARVVSVRHYATSYEHIIVDSELGRDLVFGFEWPTYYNLSIILTSPLTRRNYTTSAGYGNLSYIEALPGFSETGQWLISVTSRQSGSLRVMVRAQSKVRDQRSSAPIMVSFLLSSTEVSFSGSNEPPVVYASVSKDYAPVINATVIASLVDERGHTIDFELRDNGAGADVSKNDGTYSSYLPELNRTGMYSTRVRIVGHDGTYTLQKFKGRTILTRNDDFNSSRATSPPETMTGNSSHATVPVHPFERVSFGNLIRVISVRPRIASPGQPVVDSVPPSRIHDLTLIETSLVDQTITVRFTAVGDNFDQGRAFRYHIRHAPSTQRIYSAFNNCTPISDLDLVNATLTAPKEPGTAEVFVIRFTVGAVVVLAVAASDRAGNVGQPSNVISARIDYEPSTSAPTHPSTFAKENESFLNVTPTALPTYSRDLHVFTTANESFLNATPTALPTDSRDLHAFTAASFSTNSTDIDTPGTTTRARTESCDKQGNYDILITTVVACLSVATLFIVITAALISYTQKRKAKSFNTMRGHSESGVDNIVFSELLESTQMAVITTTSESTDPAKLVNFAILDKNSKR